MNDLDSLWLKIDLKPGTNIPAHGIPDLIALANKLGCTVKAEANGITVMAAPGDDPIDLAIAWELAMQKDARIRIAVAWEGRQQRIKLATERVSQTSPVDGAAS